MIRQKTKRADKDEDDDGGCVSEELEKWRKEKFVWFLSKNSDTLTFVRQNKAYNFYIYKHKYLVA